MHRKEKSRDREYGRSNVTVEPLLGYQTKESFATIGRSNIDSFIFAYKSNQHTRLVSST